MQLKLLLQSPLVFPGSASRLSSGLRSHPLEWGRQDLGPPELSLLGARTWGTVEGVPLELGPACVPIRRLRKQEARAKHEKCAAGGCGVAREQQGRPAAGSRAPGANIPCGGGEPRQQEAHSPRPGARCWLCAGSSRSRFHPSPSARDRNVPLGQRAG